VTKTAIVIGCLVAARTAVAMRYTMSGYGLYATGKDMSGSTRQQLNSTGNSLKQHGANNDKYIATNRAKMQSHWSGNRACRCQNIQRSLGPRSARGKIGIRSNTRYGNEYGTCFANHNRFRSLISLCDIVVSFSV
jgi:hypothetical protein